MFIDLIERQYLINKVTSIDTKMDFNKGKQSTYIKNNNKKSNTSFLSILENEIKKINK